MPDLKIDIPAAQISNAIAVAIAESFAPEKRDALLRDIVRAHLQYKRDSYDKETLLAKTVGDHVRTIAIEKVTEMVVGMRDEIGAAVERTLGPRFKESICLQLEKSLAYRVVSGIRLTVDVDDES